MLPKRHRALLITTALLATLNQVS